jgi:hypothetical protein
MAKADFDGILKAYAALVEDLDPLLFVARDGGLQRAMVPRIRELMERMDRERTVAAAGEEERVANILLGLRSLAFAAVNELECYILLKADDPNKAWDRLIDAQMGIESAMRADPSFAYLEAKGHRMREMEFYLFPPQSFMSVGLLVARQECSICRDDYDKCDHIKGRPYRGQFCSVILKEVTPDHVALVDDPANRHCRVVTYSVPGGRRDKMTWVVTPDDPAKPPPPSLPDGGMHAEGIMATLSDFGGEWPDDEVKVPA